MLVAPITDSPRSGQQSSSDGFTLLELLVVMTLVGILAAMAVPPLRSYQRAQQLTSSVRDMVSLLRNAQGTAVARSTSTRVDFAADGSSASEYVADTAGTYTLVTTLTLPTDVTILSTSFTARAGGASPSLYFYSRGTATDGSMVMRRSTGATKKVSVEGVTGRVASS